MVRRAQIFYRYEISTRTSSKPGLRRILASSQPGEDTGLLEPGEFYDRYYTDVSDDFLKWRLLGAIDKSQSVIDLTAGLDIRKVIDIGSGTGAVLKLLAPIRPSWQFLGVDIAAPAVKLIDEMDLPNVHGALFDGRRLPADDKSFDLAILSHVLEHVEDTKTLIQEAVRVASWVLLEVPIESTPILNSVWWFRTKLGRPRTPNDLGHLRFCSRSEWDRLIKNDGLTVVRSRRYTARKETLMFGKHGAAASKARLKVLGQRLLGSNLWGKLYLSNYSVLGRGS